MPIWHFSCEKTRGARVIVRFAILGFVYIDCRWLRFEHLDDELTDKAAPLLGFF